METKANLGFATQGSPQQIPSLIKYIASNNLTDFDTIEANSPIHSNVSTLFDIHETKILCSGTNPNCTGTQNLDLRSPTSFVQQGITAAPISSQGNDTQRVNSTRPHLHTISISTPCSPLEDHLHNIRRVDFTNTGIQGDVSAVASKPAYTKTRFYSQPMPIVAKAADPVHTVNIEQHPQKQQARTPRINKLKDKRFDSFKTWSGKLERQLSNIRGNPQSENGPDDENNNNEESNVPQNLPAYRYFDALEGPELDTLKASEELVLPDDRPWPFLLRFPVTSFGICLGVSSQAILWKTLAMSESTKFLRVSLTINLILWCIAIASMASITFIYALKMIFYFEAVRREYYHPIRVNFFFAPWIALLFLALGLPPCVARNLHGSLWYALMTPIFFLELKIYGQWMSGGQRRLSKVANPSNHLSVVGNFVGALLGATMGLKEGPIFFFAVGLAHYTVLFVTLYQRLPTNDTLPKELHPVFFLFVAAPSVASMAWAKITGSFDYGSRFAYFIGMFLYFSLAVRVNFFRGFRFSLAWWAYTFPMTGACIATIKYSDEVTNVATQGLIVVLCTVATLASTGLLATTMLHAFVFRDLFPNDVGIAISNRKPKTSKKWYHMKYGSSESKDVDSFLKYSGSDESKDIEAASTKNPASNCVDANVSSTTDV